MGTVAPINLDFMENKMTYKEIMALIEKQKQLIAEGKMQRPAIKSGFSAEAEKIFKTGTDVRDYFGLPKEEQKYYEKNSFVKQRKAYA